MALHESFLNYIRTSVTRVSKDLSVESATDIMPVEVDSKCASSGNKFKRFSQQDGSVANPFELEEVQSIHKILSSLDDYEREKLERIEPSSKSNSSDSFKGLSGKNSGTSKVIVTQEAIDKALSSLDDSEINSLEKVISSPKLLSDLDSDLQTFYGGEEFSGTYTMNLPPYTYFYIRIFISKCIINFMFTYGISVFLCVHIYLHVQICIIIYNYEYICIRWTPVAVFCVLVYILCLN
jgi:hypothetical protein